MAARRDAEPARKRRVSRLTFRSFLLSGFLFLVLLLVLLGGGFAAFVSQIELLPSTVQSGKADGIVVLTGGQLRIETGIDLLRAGKARRLLISGVHPDVSAGQIRKAVGAGPDDFRCCVDIDKAALDTVGNAEQAAAWVQRNGFHSIIVVTSYYHMPRTLLEMRRKLPRVALVPHFVRPASQTPWYADSDALRIAVPEYFKYLASLLRLGIREKENRIAVASAMTF